MDNEISLKTFQVRTIILPSIFGGIAIMYPFLLLGALNGSLTQGGFVVEGMSAIWAPFVMALVFSLFFSFVGALFLKVGFFLCALKSSIVVKKEKFKS